MKKPRISVLIPTYNRPEFLRQALWSVVCQTLKPYEVIVADDNQDENQNRINKSVVEEFSSKYPYIHYHKNDKNYGPVGNYKNLFNIATGDIIQFLGDDDLLSPVALEKCSKPLIENRTIFLAAGKTFFCDENLNYNPTYIILEYIKAMSLFKDELVDGVKLIAFSLSNKVVNIFSSFSGFMFRKSDIDFELFNFEGYEFIANSDIYLWFNLAKKGKAFLINEYLNLFRYHSSNDQYRLVYKGAEEKLVFYSDEFLESIGLKYDSAFSPWIQSNLKLCLESEYRDSKVVLKYLKPSKIEENFIKRKNFSIIMVTYKNEDTIQECIDSVLPTLIDGDEIILIDNSPDRETEKVIQSNYKNLKNLRFIKNSENVGYSKAINQGVKICENDLLVFLNPDTIVYDKLWLEKAYKVFSEDKQIAAIGPISDRAFFYNDLRKYIDTDLLQYLSDGSLSCLLNKLYKDVKIETNILSGFCLITRKDMFLKCGMFDENLILGYDDFDFSLYLKDNGYKQLVLPSVYIKHRNHVSFKKDIEKSEDLNKKSFYNYAKKMIRKYGYGNVPEPYECFMDDVNLMDYPFFKYMDNGRYRYMFNFSGRKKDKSFFREKANIIKSKPDIAIITVNYRTYKDVLELAQSITKNPYPNLKFIVVDNSEDDTEFQKLEEGLNYIFSGSKKEFFLIKNNNTGYAGGNNLGIKFVMENLKSKYIWFLNPDTVIAENTPIELLRTVEFTDVPVATCKIIDYHTGSCQYDGKGIYIDNRHIGNISTGGIFRVSFLSGANIFIKSEIIEKVGYFEEKFFLYFEDNEFFLRLLKNKIFPVYTPFTHIYHKLSVSTGEFLKNPVSIYYYIRNILHWTHQNTESSQLALALKNIFDLYISKMYNFNLSRKHNLIAIIKGVADYFNGVYGKFDIQSFVKQRFEKVKLSEEELLLPEKMKMLELYLYSKPRDFDSFKKFFQMGLSKIMLC